MKKTTKNKETLLIIDGNNMAHRCRHAFSLSHKGKNVSTTYGFLKTMLSAINKFKPYSVIVAWDGGVPEFRRSRVPEYKANRNHGNDDPLEYEDFIRQLNELSDYALPMAGVMSVRKRGAEADDIMYHASTLSATYSIILSSDKDMFQAVSENTSVYNPSKDVLVTVENFEEIVGIDKNNYVYWRAIQGDGSDNIPGVYGIGEKTATKLFKDAGSLTGITNSALGINPRYRMSDKLAASINSFGLDRITHNVYVMALYADRVGAKQLLLEAEWYPFNKKRFMKYLMNNAFVSLIENIGNLQQLREPVFIDDIVRTPVVALRREPV